MSGPDRPKTMLAWRKEYKSKEPMRVEVPVPSAAEDELLIKVHAAGVCHSDIAILESTEPPPGFRHLDSFTLGHEGCGEVVFTGAKVTNFTIGDMVSIMSFAGCLEPTCAECSRGFTQLCADGHHYGLDIDGSFAPYIAIRAAAAIKLPKGVSAAAGAVATDAITTAYHAVVERAQVKCRETILLYGLGGLGFNALQIILSLGARIIAVDKRQAVLEEAIKLGVPREDVVPPDAKSVTDWIQERQLVIDKVVDFLGLPETFESAIQTG
ncbi:hypothetical protein LTR84_010682 [Exophiala bonariae]|uniref:Enoyl reductase (ER) domain-containing protein n=1 Tax=Exophiala bonariae TaxID=1690606 RepID=A0AAV9MV54_9EURO|nr:hypothetical protein LTR84_010682 [Exophiala bonariae]